jgi:dihydroorotate dehydrogenase electron transfer subunit
MVVEFFMNCCDTKRIKAGVFTASVVYNMPIGERYFRLSMAFEGFGAAAFAGAKAGQFLELQVENLSIPSRASEELKDAAIRNPILRRPFSFVDIFQEEGKTIVDIVYCVIGAGTVRLSSLQTNDTVNVIGPLGNGFKASDNCKTAVMIAGGIGCPPIEHFAKQLADNNKNVAIAAFIGAKSACDLPFVSVQRKLKEGGDIAQIDEFAKLGAKSFIATDDGSCGFKGVVTAAVEKWFAENTIEAADCEIFACGPQPMLAATAKTASKLGIKCMVSLERMMACGIGLCQSCAVEVEAENGSTEYKLCCKDGPVFDSEAVVW